MTRRVAPWFHAPAAGWESARDRLPRPLTTDEAITDLRWWERQVRLGREDPATGRILAKMPGRGRLAKEWGWTLNDRVHTAAKVRALLLDRFAWEVPARPGAATSKVPANNQQSASKQPAGTQANADNGADSTSKVPANNQPSASQVPAVAAKLLESGVKNGTKKARKQESEILLLKRPQGDTAGQRMLLQILTRWTAADSGAPHPWTVKWGEVLAWWEAQIVPRPKYADLDLADQLERWDNYLERAAALHGSALRKRGDPTFPKIWKNAIHTWLGNGARYASAHTGTTNDRRPTRTTMRRRGQQGAAPSAFGLKPRDAGDHDS